MWISEECANVKIKRQTSKLFSWLTLQNIEAEKIARGRNLWSLSAHKLDQTKWLPYEKLKVFHGSNFLIAFMNDFTTQGQSKTTLRLEFCDVCRHNCRRRTPKKKGWCLYMIYIVNISQCCQHPLSKKTKESKLMNHSI